MTDSKLEIKNSGIEKIILSCASGSDTDKLCVFPTHDSKPVKEVCFHMINRNAFDMVIASAADTRALGQLLIELADQIETNKDKDQT